MNDFLPAVSVSLFVIDLVLILFCYRRRHLGLSIVGGLTVFLFLISSHTGFLVIGIVLLCLLLGQPLFVLFGSITVGCLLLLINIGSGVTLVNHLDSIVAKTMELASKEVLLAIPFFVVAGEVMTKGSLAERLIGVAKVLFGRLPGGLAIAGVFGCVFFAAISGSSPVTVIAIGSIMVPAMIKQGYPEKFAMGLISTAGSLGILIPPSIPMIIYAIVVGTTTAMDPKELFLAGVIPGAIIGLLLAGYAMVVGWREGISGSGAKTGGTKEEMEANAKIVMPSLWTEIKRGIWSLLLPLIILGGIYTGVFTTTEAAAVSVVYAVLVEVFIHGDLKLKDMVNVAEGAMTVMGSLFLIIALSLSLNDVLVRLEVTDALVFWLKSLDLTPATFLILVNLVLLAVGCFMDIISAILIIAPMLAPMSIVMGIHPLHMGIIFIVNLEIGYLTPPLGLNLFVASSLFKKGLGEVIQSVMVPLSLLLVGLMLITWIPVFSTGLPDLIAGRPLFKKKVEEKPKVIKDVAPTPVGKPLSLQELMQKQKTGKLKKESGAIQKPMSLQELMKLQKEQKENGESSTSRPAPIDKPMSLQELMKLQKERKAAGEAETKPPVPVLKIEKPMSMQEFMKLNKERKAAAKAAETSAQPAQEKAAATAP
ncbi:MAG: TRAP transporter large permease subunit [Deltaproteobacteria bacterium]|nr:TRAP transporter large permease subunit [Deltaproteobacteria bacterium]